MRSFALPLALAAILAAVSAPASAQAPAPTVTIHPKAGQTIAQLLGSGFTYTVTANAEVSFTAKLTMKYHGKTLKLTKGLRAETNYGQSADPVEYSMPYVSSTVAAKLRKLKKATVKLTVVATGAGGYAKTLTATTKLTKG
jgi:hypothetical protein